MPVAVEREEWKFDTLCDLYDTLTVTQVCELPKSSFAFFVLIFQSDSFPYHFDPEKEKYMYDSLILLDIHH